MLHYLNTVIVSAAKLHTFQTENSQTVSDYVSGITMSALFLIALAYHIFTKSHVSSTLWKWLRQKRLNRNEEALVDYPPVNSNLTDPPKPTWSSIESLSYTGRPLTAIMLEGQGQNLMSTSIGTNNQDNASRTMAGLSAPLLKKDENAN